MKKKLKIFAVKKGGGGGGFQQSPRPEREGVAAKNINFYNFHFLFFSFCHNNDYVPEILKT